MRIEEFRITRYGPLPDRGKISLGYFNFFYGVNETGKTLTLEALIKLLLGKKIKDFKNIDRVDEEVDGYIIIESEGEKKKLGRKCHLDDIVSLTSAECRNIFIIRNSDLSIAPETPFYTYITNRLTGLQTDKINILSKKILEISKLTPGGDLSDRKEDDHLKRKIEEASRLSENIKTLKEENKEEIEDLERKWLQLLDEIKTKEVLRVKLEEARKRLIYESAYTAVNVIEESNKKLEDLSAFSEEDWNKWRESEKEIKRAERKISDLKEELGKSEKELKSKESELKERANKIEIARYKKEKIDIIRPLLSDLKERKIESSSESNSGLARREYRLMVSVSLVLSILGLVIKQSLVFTILAGVFLLSFFFLIGLQFRKNRIGALLERNFSKLKLDLAESGIKGESIEDLLSEVESFTFKFGKQEDEIKEKEIYIGTLNNKIREIQRKEIPLCEKEMGENSKDVQKIKAATFVNNLEDFGKKIREKENLEITIEKEKRALKELIGEKKWEDRIEELKTFKDKSKDIEFNEKEYENLANGISLSKEKLVKVEGKLNQLSEKFKEIERRANNILSMELRCDGSTDLENIEKKIKDFISEKEITKEDAITALGILREIANEEKTKIGEQFGEESPVSNHFFRMTEGIYNNVEFNEETEEIEIQRKDGVKLSSRQLSGGTHDQLYFSIRLALGEKLLGEEKGFFILDDPFVKASHDRLRVLIDMLKDICRSGWQVIYFSAKEEVREMLGKDKEVKFIELERII